MAFSNAWSKLNWHTKKLEKHLPRIDETDEDALDDDLEVAGKDEKEPTGLMQRIDQKLTEVTRLQAVQDRQRLLLYLVIGLLAWLFIKSL